MNILAGNLSKHGRCFETLNTYEYFKFKKVDFVEQMNPR